MGENINGKKKKGKITTKTKNHYHKEMSVPETVRLATEKKSASIKSKLRAFL